MANKKKIEERLKAQKVEQTTRIIQWVGGGLLLAVVIGLIWLLVRGKGSNVVELPPDVPAAAQASSDATNSSNSVKPAYKQYDAYPPRVIDVTKKYFAKFTLAKGGEFTVELYSEKAPLTVNNFVFLAKDGFYNGTTFHRVLPDFMAQGGDPAGTGGGGPGYEFDNEYSDLTFDKEGVLAMANAGKDTNGSQFFITFSPQEYLNGGYTIFGQVIEGMDVVKGITLRDPDQNPNFTGDVIKTITITEE